MEDEDKDESSIQSSSVVKYSSTRSLTQYHKLQQHFDIKVLPTNWLVDQEMYGQLQSWCLRRKNHKEFSSILLGGLFTETVGRVDIICGSEVIKKLLKMPFSNSELSISVHRVGQTLFLDELDVPELVKQGLKRGLSMRWLLDLFRGVQSSHQNTLSLHMDTSPEQDDLHILSKFLYHSLASDEDAQIIESDTTDCSGYSGQVYEPEPYSELFSQMDDSQEQQTGSVQFEQPLFERTVLWSFDDISMLVGSNMPIFGGGKYPAVSLRLRDAEKPITVLTGIDYWLDNLICNVPEVAMCFHINGIVQNYSLYQTFELPHMKGSRFSPRVIRDIAENLLQFLKSNCTKEGHTYWLVREEDGEYAKLYDLSSICDQETQCSNENPFSLPVAMLMFRITCNMMIAEEMSLANTITMRKLLLNCMRILSKKEGSDEIYLTATILLAVIYTYADAWEIPDACRKTVSDSIQDPGYVCLEDDDDLDQAPFSLESTEDFLEISVRELSHPGTSGRKLQTKDKLLLLGVEERCRAAICCLAKVSDCVRQKLLLLTQGARGGSAAPGASNVRKSYNPPPSLFSRWGFKLKVPAGKACSTGDDNRLAIYLSVCCRAYMMLAENMMNAGKYGRTLRCLKICSCLLDYAGSRPGLRMENISSTRSLAAMMAGDALCLMSASATNMVCHQEDFSSLNTYDIKLLGVITPTTAPAHFSPSSTLMFGTSFRFVPDREGLLSSAIIFYERGINFLGTLSTSEAVVLSQHYGNVLNELGSHRLGSLLDLCLNRQRASSQWATSALALLMKTHKDFERALEAFTLIKDKPNMVVVLSNMAKLYRLGAQIRAQPETAEDKLTPTQITYKEYELYVKAISCNVRINDMLGDNTQNADMRANNTMDLNRTYLRLATHLQRRPPLLFKTLAEVESECVHFYRKSLHGFESMLGHPLHNRSALLGLGQVHSGMGSYYQSIMRRDAVDEAQRRIFYSMAELHYNKAVTLMDVEHNPVELLRCCVEQIGLVEFCSTSHADGSPSSAQKCCLMVIGYLTGDHVLAALSEIARRQEDDLPDEAGAVMDLLLVLLNQAVTAMKARLKGLTNQGTLPPGNSVEVAPVKNSLRELLGILADDEVRNRTVALSSFAIRLCEALRGSQ